MIAELKDDSFVNSGTKLVRRLIFEDFEIDLDLAKQVLHLAAEKNSSFSEGDANVVPAISTFASRKFLSASVLAFKAKQFDDGLYAAAELAAQNGAGKYAGKNFLLTGLARKLTDSGLRRAGALHEIVFAAIQLGGLGKNLPSEIAAAVGKRVAHFLGNESLSKPIGFYTWTDSLKAVFQQDKMLQSETSVSAGAEAIAQVLQANQELRTAYDGYLRFSAKLTNGLAQRDLRELIDGSQQGNSEHPSGTLCFFPPSRAHETDLGRRLYGDKSIPDGFSLVDEFIRRIRAGTIDLTLSSRSGWYDYQTWALEPLVRPEKMPEAARLTFDSTYCSHLLEMFKGIIALTRETHTKQLVLPLIGAELGFLWEETAVDIRPKLTVEPLATYYLRRAASYRFIRDVLIETFGQDALKEMHRLTPLGRSEANLDDELTEMTALFHGAYITVYQQLGLTPDSTADVGSDQTHAATAAFFQNWVENIGKDSDLKEDARMMAPLFYDVQRKKFKVWVFLGWMQKPVTISFESQPVARVKNNRTSRRIRFGFKNSVHDVIRPVSAEIYVDKVLSREELRRYCDRCKTRSAILDNLTWS